MLAALRAAGFDVLARNHAEAILSHDFPQSMAEIVAALAAFRIEMAEVVGGGGGESGQTQRLRHALAEAGWRKHKFNVQTIVDGIPREGVSHEVDHVRFTPAGALALEIEWNNKDPFYDRDLENFQRLHANGAISVGVIVTRGRSLHENMRAMVGRFLDERQVRDLGDLLQWGYDPTAKQRAAIQKRMQRAKNPLSFRDAFVDKFVADKFGEATTHWRKLDDRLRRGVGNPCPLVLIGLPDSIVTFHEGKAALAEVEAVEAALDAEEEAEARGA